MCLVPLMMLLMMHLHQPWRLDRCRSIRSFFNMHDMPLCGTWASDTFFTVQMASQSSVTAALSRSLVPTCNLRRPCSICVSHQPSLSGSKHSLSAWCNPSAVDGLIIGRHGGLLDGFTQRGMPVAGACNILCACTVLHRQHAPGPQPCEYTCACQYICRVCRGSWATGTEPINVPERHIAVKSLAAGHTPGCNANVWAHDVRAQGLCPSSNLETFFS